MFIYYFRIGPKFLKTQNRFLKFCLEVLANYLNNIIAVMEFELEKLVSAEFRMVPKS